MNRTISVLMLGNGGTRQYNTPPALYEKQTRIVPRTSRAAGIIVLDAPDSATGGWKKRLGICVWDVDFVPGRNGFEGRLPSEYRNAVETFAGISEEWKRVECIFG